MKTIDEIFHEFNARIGGDDTVDVYSLFRDISSAIDRPEGRVLLGKPLQWCGMMLDRWHRQYRSGKSDVPVSLYDTLQCVSILMESDLWVFETRNEARYKQLLFDNHRQYLDAMFSPIHNVNSIHDAQCTMHNESSNDRSDYALSIMTCFGLSAVDYELTKAMQSFLLASVPYLSFDEYTKYDSQIRSGSFIKSQE